MGPRIDVFCHILPRRYNEARWRRGEHAAFVEHSPTHLSYTQGGKIAPNYQILTDLEARFRMMEEFGDYRQVISVASPAIEIVDAGQSDELARILNDELAELVEKHPRYFAGAVASLPMNKPDAAARELERAIRKLKLAGLELFSNVLGKPLDQPEFRPIFQMMAEYDLPILLHPARSRHQADYATEDHSRYLLWQILGWPYESSVAAARLVFSGILEDFSSLRIILHHTGAMVPFFAGRIEAMHRMFEPLIGAELGKPLRKPVLDYFSSFYADTSTVSTASIECACRFFGADHVLFGTDAPFDAEGGRFSIRASTRAIEEAGISAEEKSRVFYKNFEKVFRSSAAVGVVKQGKSGP